MRKRDQLVIGGPPRAPAALLYEAICSEVDKLPLGDRRSLAYALNDSDPYESLPGSVKALFEALAAWAWSGPQPTGDR